ncbi:MAG: hypothetical protein HC804_09820 [Anaerolineae bacterium]|nr:hypothetical protein [Anaerolineae bacterium]
MEIVENLDAWSAEFAENWLRHYHETGETLWKVYNRARNETAVAGPGIDLAHGRLLFISTAGGYVAGEQEPFDAANLLGDYTVRTFPVDMPLSKLAYAHDHYDHTAVTSDPQVLLPLTHLQEMVAVGEIGSLHPQVISFHGYQPDVRRIVHELIPAVFGGGEQGKVDGALLVPA